ncbi:hypothetical protein T484DRAFT_1954461 [Baffinella frigidus]|nr:hypothetical protein T484DRAFT_1954461 [Cryptophyta sp. CCMP2293]
MRPVRSGADPNPTPQIPGRKRRRYSQPESPTATAPPDTKVPYMLWAFGFLDGYNHGYMV